MLTYARMHGLHAYTHTCIHLSVHEHTYTSTYMHTRAHAHIPIYLHMHANIFMTIYAHICIYICRFELEEKIKDLNDAISMGQVCVCIYIDMYTYISVCIYIHT